jgi:ribosomal protein S18 acetylase RimI-like enzyme
MRLSDTPTPEDDARERIYRYVERNGAVKPVEVSAEVGVDPESFSHHLSMLKRDGYLAEREGRLEVVVDAGEAEQHRESGVAYTVRPARQADLSGVYGAIEQVATARTSIVAESVGEQLQVEDALVRHNRFESRVFFVATVDGEVVGWAHLRTPNQAKLAHTAQATTGVLEEYRRHGIGSHLLARSTEYAASEGYERLYDSLPATNQHGVAFLLANGWEIEAVRSDHYRMGNEYVDEVMLARDLT